MNIPTSNQREGRKCPKIQSRGDRFVNYLQQTHNAYYCPTGFIASENSNGSVREGFWRDIVRSEGVAGLQEIGNVRG